MAQTALDFDSLPEDAVSRQEVFELRTVPSAEKPPLSKAREARLAGLEEATAQCYTEMEETTYRLRQMAKRIGDTVPTRSRSASEYEASNGTVDSPISDETTARIRFRPGSEADT